MTLTRENRLIRAGFIANVMDHMLNKRVPVNQTILIFY